jgi:hypothetical protein
MPLNKQEFYEGAAMRLLASTGRIVGIIADAPFFILNGRLLVMVKYTTKGRSPWGFSFSQSEQRKLQQKSSKFKTKIGLVCGSDGVATLDYQADFLQIAAPRDAAIHVSCYRDHGEHYEINGPDGALKRKIAPSNWQKIFE